MHIILRYPDGSRVQGLLLSEDSARLRVTIPGRKDTLELQLVNDRWVDEDGHKVSIEAMVFGRYASGEATAGSAADAPVKRAPGPHREQSGPCAPERLRCTASG
jgi:hypothetical protein